MPRKPQQLINDWNAAIELNRKAYLSASRSLDRYHYAIGVTVFLLSVLGGTALAFLLPNAMLRVLAGTLGGAIAVLSAIQTFYSHAKLSEAHRAAAAQLDQLQHEIEELEKLPPRYLEGQSEILLQMDQRLQTIEQSAPPLKRELVRQLRSQAESSEHLVKKIKQTA